MSAFGAPARNRPGATLTIGDVLTALKGEFADLTISKIRFLETEGLVHPDRTPSGYRKFAPDDVARLRYVLSQQKYHFLPLRVIREQLEAMDRGLVPPGTTAVPHAANVAVAAIQDNAPTADAFRPAPATMRLSKQELLNSAGLHPDQLTQLEQFGLIAARPGGYYDDDALAVGRIVAELARFGLEGRHLRAFRTAAEREVGLFSQVVGPLSRQRSSEARVRADEAVRELAALSVRLHAALVQIGLREVVGGA